MAHPAARTARGLDKGGVDLARHLSEPVGKLAVPIPLRGIADVHKLNPTTAAAIISTAWCRQASRFATARLYARPLEMSP